MEGFTCPVCGKVLTEKELPDRESITDEFCGLHSIHISRAILQFDFTHLDVPEESHRLTALMEIECDEKGMCTRATVLEVRKCTR